MSELYDFWRRALAPLLACPECNGRGVMEYPNYPKIEWTDSGTNPRRGVEVSMHPGPTVVVEVCRSCRGRK